MKYVLTGTETKRLRFELLTLDHFDAWMGLFKQKEAATFLGLDNTRSPKELCQKWFDKIFHRYENDLGGMNVLIDKETGNFVGQCGLLIQEVEGQKRMEIGYSILPQFWGKGYATEAAVKCKEIAFEHGYTETLISIVHVDNIASATVARKNGMRIEKHLESYHDMPVNIFSITKT